MTRREKGGMTRHENSGMTRRENGGMTRHGRDSPAGREYAGASGRAA
jgi:hypothetical protein